MTLTEYVPRILPTFEDLVSNLEILFQLVMHEQNDTRRGMYA